jgi:N-dimethylarginine dimethylaminohydrolase
MTAPHPEPCAPHAAPEQYYQTFFPALPEPAFEDPAELERCWGARWGAADEVGPLRQVLMRRPGPEFAQIRADAWDPAVGALVDPRAGWYWESAKPPDLGLIQRQYDGLVAALQAEGVRVHFAEPLPERFSKAIYTRDPLITVPGGAIIGRLAPAMRRGEEASITRAVAALGMPILHTIGGTGLLEGGSFAKLRRKVAVFGTSIRCNVAAARQLEEMLRWVGIELIVVALGGYSIHLDGHFGMVDVDKALVEPAGLPHWFLDRLRELGIEAIWCAPGEAWAINSLVVRPGRVLMCDGYPQTAERLERRGVEVVRVAYDEIQKNGGGIHCSTMELVREEA